MFSPDLLIEVVIQARFATVRQIDIPSAT